MRNLKLEIIYSFLYQYFNEMLSSSYLMKDKILNILITTLVGGSFAPKPKQG